MLEKGKMNAGEFLILIIAFSVGGTILDTPALIIKAAKQDAWISYLLTTFVGLFFIFLYNQIAALYPSMTYVEINEKVFGKWIGKIMALLYLFYFYYLSAAMLRDVGDFFTTEILIDTPIEIIMIMFLLTSLIGVRLGLEVISRTSLIFFPWIMLLLFMLFLFVIPIIKVENIQPILGAGIKSIMRGSYHGLGLPFLELAIFLMVTPYISDKTKMKKAFYKGTLSGGFLITIIILVSILVLGSDLAARQTYPSFMIAKKISIGHFLERIEAIVAIVWILTIYFRLTICYYGLSLGLAQVLGLKSYKILLFPLAFFIVTFSTFSHPSIVHFNTFTAETWPPYSLTICFFLPLLLLAVGKIRKIRSANNANKLPVN